MACFALRVRRIPFLPPSDLACKPLQVQLRPCCSSMAINLARFHDRVYTVSLPHKSPSPTDADPTAVEQVIRAIPEGQVTSYGTQQNRLFV